MGHRKNSTLEYSWDFMKGFKDKFKIGKKKEESEVIKTQPENMDTSSATGTKPGSSDKPKEDKPDPRFQNKGSKAGRVDGKLGYSFYWLKGRRPTQEDAHMAATITDSIYAFGVFDGHGNSDVSKFVSEEIPKVLKEECKNGK